MVLSAPLIQIQHPVYLYICIFFLLYFSKPQLFNSHKIIFKTFLAKLISNVVQQAFVLLTSQNLQALFQ